MGTAVMITSGKGGTGKTSLTAGVASCLAALGKRVLCIDLDIGLRNLDLVLGMSDRAVMDFSDVMAYRCSLLSGAARSALFTCPPPLLPFSCHAAPVRDARLRCGSGKTQSRRVGLGLLPSLRSKLPRWPLPHASQFWALLR